MEPKSTTPPPPAPVLGAPVGYPPAAVYPPSAAAAGYPHAPALYAPPPPPPPAAASQQAAAAQQQQLQMFWAEQYREIEATTDFKNHNLPLARIKKIMKADEDVRMIAAEAPVVFARACEMFILELTHRGWAHAEENKRRTLQRNDVAAAIARTDVFDFLVDIVPREEAKEEPGSSALGFAGAGAGPGGAPAAGLPYYYPPMGQPAPMMPAWHVPAWDPAWQQGGGADVDQAAAGGGFGAEDGQGFTGHGGPAGYPSGPPSSE